MHFARKQNSVQSFVNLHNRPIILFRRRKQYFLQEVFARLYFLVKITPAKVSINFTRHKGLRILLLLSNHMLFIIEKIISTGADVSGVELYRSAECL